MRPTFTTVLALLALPLAAQQQPPTRLTIYNNDFAVARTTVPLNLHPGLNEVTTTAVTSQLEPDSVVLRDPTTGNPIPVLEQNYDAGLVNQAWLLQKYEGKTIDFEPPPTLQTPNPPAIPGRIIRAGNDPLIEVNGKMLFRLPGTPLFPVETDGLLLKPTLRWHIDAQRAASQPAELDYITHGLTWQATYNLIVPDTTGSTASESADLLGWITLENHSGADFPQTTIQLMAGDVAKIQNRPVNGRNFAMMALAAPLAKTQEVTQKAFDDFHLYDLHRTMNLRNDETKQVQFLEAAHVTVQRTYEFEGNEAFEVDAGSFNDQGYGVRTNVHVAVRERFKNSEANHLGMPLPAGRLRLYRRDAKDLQFVGESMIPHTPAEQQVDVTTGSAFDVTATQRQTEFQTNTRGRTIDEAFEIKLSNQKSDPVTVHVIEHLNRSQNWKVAAHSADFTRRDSSTIDFPILVPVKGEATLTYSTHYSW